MRGTNISNLDSALLEHFGPGDHVRVTLGVNRDLSDAELNALAEKLAGNGSIKEITFSPGKEWPYALSMEFTRPSRKAYAATPLPVMLIGLGAALGAGAFIGWEITRAVKNRFPVGLAIGGGIALVGIIALSKT